MKLYIVWGSAYGVHPAFGRSSACAVQQNVRQMYSTCCTATFGKSWHNDVHHLPNGRRRCAVHPMFGRRRSAWFPGIHCLIHCFNGQWTHLPMYHWMYRFCHAINDSAMISLVNDIAMISLFNDSAMISLNYRLQRDKNDTSNDKLSNGIIDHWSNVSFNVGIIWLTRGIYFRSVDTSRLGNC